MKKILLIVHNLKFGGVQKITVELARNHASLGNEVHILCLEKGKLIDIDFDCHVHTLDLGKFLLKHPILGVYYLLYKVLLRYLLPEGEFFFAKPIFKPQILTLLNALESKQPFDGIFIRGSRAIKRTWWLNRKEAVSSIHLPYHLPTNNKGVVGRYNQWLANCLFKDKSIFAVSEYIAADLKKSLSILNVVPKILTVINNPCDIERVKLLCEQKVEVPDVPYILGVGRLTKQKRFDVLIRAYHQANIKNYKLVILGEGNQKPELEKLISELQLNDFVIMPGFVKNPYPWYKKAKLFVLSSDVEGFGNVLAEALVCGTPVVSTDCGPVSEVLRGHLKSGIVPIGDHIVLAAKINEYLNSPVFPLVEELDWLSFENVISKQMMLASDDAFVG
jgi:glycosyltransferase involved in cell wall biosynthesis